MSRVFHDIAAFFTGGAPTVTGFTDSNQMVDGLVGAAQGHPIEQVRFDDHASPGMQQAGDERLTAGALAPGMPAHDAFAELGANMTTDGVLQFGGCQVGEGASGEALLRAAAAASGVTTEGGTHLQRPTLPGLDGSKMVCSPNAETGDVDCDLFERPVQDAILDQLDAFSMWLM
jgi:Domain of unknown function (DUF4347)